MTRHDPAVLLLVALFLPFVVHSGPSGPTLTATNSTSVPDGWLQLPAHELILDVQQQALEYGARRDASELVQSVLDVLLRPNYSVRFSDEFIQAEIRYYRDNAAREQLELSQAIQKCLSTARASGKLDWECFKGDLTRPGDPTAAARHLPWLAPPFKANLVSLAGVGVTNVPCLHLSLKWTGRAYRGAVQHKDQEGWPAKPCLLKEMPPSGPSRR